MIPAKLVALALPATSLPFNCPSPRPGLSDAAASSASDDTSARYLDAFAAFRDDVRALAKAKAEPREVLAACDRVRDSTLVDMGVRLEDRPDGEVLFGT